MRTYMDILFEQLAIDFCCRPEDVRDSRNHFNEHRFLEGRRKFKEADECYLKLAVINGKLLFAGKPEILGWCEEQYHDLGGEWFLEAKNMLRMNERFLQDGYQIASAHPFFLPVPAPVDPVNPDNPGDPGNTGGNPDNPVDPGDPIHLRKPDSAGYELRWYEADDLEQFRGDDRYKNAFGFCEYAPDVLGVAALEHGQITGMAGASCDSPTMWQIGIDVSQNARHRGIGKMLVSKLKNEILKRGVLPFYGTGMSHFASQKVALGAGFRPAWAELSTEKCNET